MNGLIAPIDITKNGLRRGNSIKESIDTFLEVLLNSVCGETAIDPQFGFVFNNMRFEIFNERDGVILNSQEEDDKQNDLYSKKISGNSRNLNTFAIDLKAVVEKYEPRLEDITTSMSYVRGERRVYITVVGVIIETKEKYQYDTILKIWN